MLTNKLLGTMNTNIANFISEMRNVSSAPIREINQEIQKTPQKIGMAEQDVLNLAEKLKEAEAQCKAFGDTSKANKLKEMLKMINAETTDVKGSMNELRQYIEKTFGTDALKQFDKELKNIDKTTQKVGKKSNFGSSLKTALGIGTVALGIRKAVGFLKDATTESIDFVETQNLFNVSMGKTVDQYGNLDREASKYYTKAMSFQEKLSDKLKINIEESMEYQALFNAMSKSMGIGDEPSYKISENFTKLGYDLSSLYNIDPENAMQKLRAGLSGQTKPLRDLGLDITQQSLEPLLDELGIERSTKQLSQAEKMIARYIVVLRQASLAHGDFAKTMDSPANQLRIFNAQLTAFKRNMGNLWQGLLGNILPYVNAIMMVINELLKMVAKLFGFEVADQNVNISAGVGADDLADDLGVATSKAKELKKQLMGFDEINNITLPDKTSSGSGASVGGIDQRLLDAMKEYDKLMDKVKSKADEIKDKMMAWLGFERDDDGTWKLKEGYTNIEKILDIARLTGIAFATWKLSQLVGKIKEFKKELGAVAIAVSLVSSKDTLSKMATEGFSGETIVKSLLESLGFTVGAVALGVPVPVSIGIALTLLAIKILAGVDNALGIDKSVWKPIYDTLGIEYSNDIFGEGQYKLRFSIIMDLQKIFTNKVAEAFEKIKSWIMEQVYNTSLYFIDLVNSAFSWIPGFKEKIENAKQIVNNAIDNEKQKREELTIATEQLNARVALSEQLKNAVISENNDKIKESLAKLSDTYKVVGEETEENLSKQIELQQQYANDVKKIYEDNGKEINEETKNNLNERIKTLADKLIEQTNQIEVLTPDQIEAWKQLAEGSEQIYNEKISNVNEDTRLILEAILGKVDINSPEYINKWAKMASESNIRYNNALASLPEDTRNKIQASVTAINGKAPELTQASSNVGIQAKREFDKGLGDTKKSGDNFLAGFAKAIQAGGGLLGKNGFVSNLASKILGTFNKGLGNASPSKKTKKSAFFFMKGFSNEIQSIMPSSLQQIKELANGITNEFDNSLGIGSIANGITINPNDFKINANQFIDYGQISGAIQTQSNVNVSSDIEGRIENAIYRGLSNATIPVEIEATTDEGVIFKKVQVKAREFYMQTGEAAFDF